VTGLPDRDDQALGAISSVAPRREGVFDHAVLNLHFDLDAGDRLFKSLGFNVAPRSYHTLGSMNNLIVFDENYLELIGLDPSNPNPRKELLDWPVGLNGLVYKSVDIYETARCLAAKNLPALEPKAFQRDVVFERGPEEARFRTVHLAPGYLSSSRLYFCEHQTPHLVWHDALLSHPNSAFSLNRLVIMADDYEEQAHRLGRVLDSQPDPYMRIWGRGTRMDFVSPEQLAEFYGGHADPGTGAAKVVVISIAVRSIANVKAAMQPSFAERLIDIDSSRSILPASECFGVLIEFVATNVSMP
jgi:Glyoxalase-like domain